MNNFIPNPVILAFIWGLIGGSLIEIWGMYNIRKLEPNERPPWLTSPFYWFWTIVMIIIGGGISMAYSFDININPILGINVGASAPSIVAAFAEHAPNIEPGKVDVD